MKDGSEVSLFCARCDARLSKTLRSIASVGSMNALCNLAVPTGTPVPEGYVLHMRHATLRAYKEINLYWNADNIYQDWMNLGDLQGTPKYTHLRARLNGCCGYDGHNGPNRICTCGTEIGTESSDCWTFDMFVPEPENTKWKFNV